MNVNHFRDVKQFRDNRLNLPFPQHFYSETKCEMRMVELTILMPTFNEGAHIERTMRKVMANLKSLKLSPEVLVIDDSTDDTPKILNALSKEFLNLRIIHREKGGGVGSALRLGIRKAQGEYVIIYMADAPDDTRYFPAILEKLRQGYDVVQTSRFIGGSRMVGYPFKKRVSNWLCNRFINVIFLNFYLKDFSSLFKGFRKDSVLALNLEANQFDLGLEIVLKAMRKGYRIIEVPVDWFERESGESKLKLSRYAKDYLTRVIGIWLFYRK